MKQSFFSFFLVWIIAVCFVACNNETKTAADSAAVVEKKPVGPGNKDVYEVINTGNWSKLDSLIAKDGIDHTPMGDLHGLDSIKSMLMQIRNAYPDIKIEAIDEAAQGDLIFTRYRYTGTNTGAMNGMPATNKKVTMTGIDVVKLKDGKLYEHWDYSDNLEYFKQLGVDPLAPPPKK
jgi:steroid delta-isomerase-like uncharacterized protein